MIGDRLRELRKEKNLSQGDIEQRTGLLRCYISRIENGHSVPSLETLEKMAGALQIPLYQLFYEGTTPPKAPILPKRAGNNAEQWGLAGKWANMLRQFQELLAEMKEPDRKLLLGVAFKMARKK